MARNSPSKEIALGGVLAALGVVVMCMGTLIPLATYVCPMLCCLMLKVVLQRFGVSVAWAWYGAVAILSVLMSPDKEAASVFVFLGYYPILKPKLDRMKLGWFLKALMFNSAVLVMYWLLIHLFGMAQISAEFHEMGTVLLIVTLILGNVTFFLLDRVLSLQFRRRGKHG